MSQQQQRFRLRLVDLSLLLSLGRRYIWRSTRNFIKTVIGREVHFNEEALFFRQCFLHLTGLRPMRQITSLGLPGEGAGSQAFMIMNAIAFARCFDLTYLHSPFSRVAHAKRPMKEWAEAWERFFHLGAGEVACDVPRRDVVNYCRNFTELRQIFDRRRSCGERERHFRQLVPEFRRRYYLDKNPRNTEEVVVAVHVRRGDALPSDLGYYTANEVILRTMSGVKLALEARGIKYRMCLYSEGDRADFGELCIPGVEFFLNADAVWTLGELIEADVLILAKGFFSYYAALISDGTKIGGYEAAGDWSPCQPDNWISCRADGSFDDATFERELLRLVHLKAQGYTPSAAPK